MKPASIPDESIPRYGAKTQYTMGVFITEGHLESAIPDVLFQLSTHTSPCARNCGAGDHVSFEAERVFKLPS